jgi:hypothetical protein
MRGIIQVPRVLPPAVAGLFHPHDPEKLRAEYSKAIA